MKRFGLILAASLGLATAVSLPASANIATYTLSCNTVACGSPTTYGTVSLNDNGGSGTVTVTVSLAPNTFAGTGAGYALNWNISGAPALTTTLSPTDVPNPSDPAHPYYTPDDFTIINNTAGGTTKYSASTFGGGWDYAIDFDINGGKSTSDNLLIFDVTKSGGLSLANFVPNNGFMFAVDIWQQSSGKTFVVAAKVPEPATWLMFFAGLAVLTVLMMQRRRKLVRAA